MWAATVHDLLGDTAFAHDGTGQHEQRNGNQNRRVQSRYHSLCCNEKLVGLTAHNHGRDRSQANAHRDGRADYQQNCKQ